MINQKHINKKVTSNKAKHAKAEEKTTDLKNKVAQISEKGFDFLLVRMYFTGINGYQDLLSGYRLEYHLKKLNHLILILNRPCLI